jgi:hypothetical protein
MGKSIKTIKFKKNMARYILKIHDDKLDKDFYLDWSSVVDAPITRGMSLEEFNEYLVERYGWDNTPEDLERRMKRVEATGTSAFGYENTDSFFKYNRAGDNEKTLNKEQILEKYCR